MALPLRADTLMKVEFTKEQTFITFFWDQIMPMNEVQSDEI